MADNRARRTADPRFSSYAGYRILGRLYDFVPRIAVAFGIHLFVARSRGSRCWLDGVARRGPAPSGRVVIAWHVTISPAWFDPSAAPPQITPFGMLYAIHDALVRPYPGQKMARSLAESWQESEDGLTYEFKLRPGLKFHNVTR